MQYKAAVITVSNSCALGERSDITGNHMVGMLTVAGYKVVKRITIPDDEETIYNELIKACDEENISLINTTVSSGLPPTDVKTTERSFLSRGISGMRKKSLIINLPSKLITVEEGLDIILPSIRGALDTLTKDYSQKK